MGGIPEGLRHAMGVPLADALLTRRSRRFGLGMTMPPGPLSHESRHAPVPLSEVEEAMLLWLGTGTTGLALGDLPGDGLTWMHTWAGHSWPCSCNSHSTRIFFTNDSGVFTLRPPEPPRDAETAPFAALSEEDALDRLLSLYRSSLVRLEDGRADLPEGEPGIFSFNAWNVNRPGTTFFVPVTNTTVEYLTLLFIYFDKTNRFTIVDELAGGGRCGLDRWVASGRLGLTEMALVDLEIRVLTSLNVEQAFMCQNMNLVLQALGLGGWMFTGFLPHHILGVDPAHRGLGFDFVTPQATPRHAAKPVPVGRRGVVEALCPPYVADAHEAVQRFLAEHEGAEEAASPYGRHGEVMAGRAHHSAETVEIVTAFVQYLLDTYGRFPVFIDPMYVRLAFQAHHLDLEFYDRHYAPGAYTEAHREHFRRWHPDIAADGRPPLAAEVAPAG
ncbi:MAG: hypothetical protein AB1416_01830 [Actinomycetota bacterium]